MAESMFSLEHVTFAWPDGHVVFHDLELHLDRRHTGLVGRNGVGKSVLARVLAGELEPSAGCLRRAGRVHYVPQHIPIVDGSTVATVAGSQRVIDALHRIEAGRVDAADFELVGERWDIRQRLQDALVAQGLGHLSPDQSARDLSGGELTRVALLGAWLAEPDLLVLDEPTNHLDRVGRSQLLQRLSEWSKGLLVISHDRELLQGMQRIVDLSPGGLRDYGGGYAFYAQIRAQERELADQQLRQRKAGQRRGEADLRERQENLSRRQARASREGKQANQAAILLGGRKQNSQVSAGKRQAAVDASREQLAQGVREAAQRAGADVEIDLLAPAPMVKAQRKVATLEQLQLPFGSAAGCPLDLTVWGRQRIALTGDNGSGKSTLLKLLAGRLQPAAGRCEVHVPMALLDQHLDMLDPQASALKLLSDANPSASQADLRTRLALLGLTADAVLKPAGQLSGGERLKLALARALYRTEPAQLLLLDEPTNHLDLRSLQALEQMLLQYPAALIVVSHDRVFLDRLALDHGLALNADGGRLMEY